MKYVLIILFLVASGCKDDPNVDVGANFTPNANGSVWFHNKEDVAVRRVCIGVRFDCADRTHEAGDWCVHDLQRGERREVILPMNGTWAGVMSAHAQRGQIAANVCEMKMVRFTYD